jgi:ribosomal protein L37AE/L43A
MKLTCEKCGKQTLVLYRTNEIGMVPAEWSCRECAEELDEGTVEICNLLTKSSITEIS